MLGKQSYLATRQGKIKGAGGKGGEEQSLCPALCCPHVLLGSGAAARVPVLLGPLLGHHLLLLLFLPSTHLGAAVPRAPPWQGVGTVPTTPPVPCQGTKGPPCTGHCSEQPRAPFPACSRQSVPATPFEESSKSVFEMPHDETA